MVTSLFFLVFLFRGLVASDVEQQKSFAEVQLKGYEPFAEVLAQYGRFAQSTLRSIGAIHADGDAGEYLKKQYRYALNKVKEDVFRKIENGWHGNDFESKFNKTNYKYRMTSETWQKIANDHERDDETKYDIEMTLKEAFKHDKPNGLRTKPEDSKVLGEIFRAWIDASLGIRSPELDKYSDDE